MTGILEDICIRGIAAAVPEQTEENIEAAAFLGEKRCRRQIKITGIETRHVTPAGQRITDLCYMAGKAMIEHLSWKPDDIKVIVLLTQSPNYAHPSTAFQLQKMLNVSQDCVVFDVNLGCSAFNTGLQIVSALLHQFPGKAKGLCFQGDLAYRICKKDVDPDVMADYMLFGSAGSVAAIEKESGVGDIPFATYSDGSRYNAILRGQSDLVSMDGETVFNFSVNDVSASICAFREKYKLSDDKIDYYVFHQAQKLILDNLALTCNIAEAKELRSLKDYGNTSGASIPLTICANKNLFREKRFINVLSCGFGVGLSWSMSYVALDVDNILPVIYTDVIVER